MLGDEVFAYPLTSKMLEFFSLKEIEDSVSIKLDILKEGIDVCFSFKTFYCMNNYAISRGPVETLDPSLDFRLFPDYDLCSLARPGKQIPQKEDQYYFARIRLSKALSLIEQDIVPIFEQDSLASLAPRSNFEKK